MSNTPYQIRARVIVLYYTIVVLKPRLTPFRTAIFTLIDHPINLWLITCKVTFKGKILVKSQTWLKVNYRNTTCPSISLLVISHCTYVYRLINLLFCNLPTNLFCKLFILFIILIHRVLSCSQVSLKWFWFHPTSKPLSI